MIRFFYNLLFPVALLLFLPGSLLKMRRRGNYRRNFGQRLGMYDREIRTRLSRARPAWIHAVSVGEVAIALKLAAKLRAIDPRFSCVLTTTTTTGYSFAEREAPDWTQVLYNPLDYWPIVRNAFAAIQPTCLILVEAEVWPNLVATAHARGLPVALVNARLSARSERRFRLIRRLVEPTFRLLDLVCAQELADIARWEALGVRPDVIRHTGSIKYDPLEGQSDSRRPLEVLRELSIASARPILLGGSTHRGEEKALATVFAQLRAGFPELFLVIAPRHAERTGEVRAELEQLGLRVALRSRPADSSATSPNCLLVDTTGELRNWYAVATVVFIGKSLAAHGGQNPVEPLFAGRPVIFGPHMENFAALAHALVTANAAIAVQDEADLARACADLLRDSARRDAMVASAGQVLAQHRGAAERTAELLLRLLHSSGAAGGE